ncbi:MAG: putative phosphoglycerate mutase [Parcubacteria group bacterium Gr01-1014_38]|nr:MAG: putative phosphoglycerate mutase [Parcubacteria group bacterium Gr01-1014_38]
MKAVVYTDGGARGNPGPAAIGVVIQIEGKKPMRMSEAIGTTTNNVAEYRALLRALHEAKNLGVTELECRLDSELVVKQLNREYKVRNLDLAPLFIRVWNLAQGFRTIRFVAVPRSENREADRLVNTALSKAGHPKKPAPYRARASA